MITSSGNMADGVADEERISRLRKRAEETEKMVSQLRQCVEVLKQKAVESSNVPAKQEASQLEQENKKLKKEVDNLRKALIELETRNGNVQISLPSTDSITMETTPPAVPVSTPSKITEAPPAEQNKTNEKPKNEKPKEKVEKPKEKKEKAKSEKSSGGKAATAQQPVDVSRCDFRVGKIVHCERHPDADALYVEKIDIGEEKPRTVLSGLVKDYSLEEMQNRMVIVICNLKPRNMRGILSEAMVMCAFTTDPETSQFIDPPPGSIVGERITFEGYEGEPDSVLNPKKKIFEQVQPELRTDENCVAMYKGVPFTVPGKGICKTASFSNCGIK